jgi:CRISPR-associated protein Cas1
LQKRLWQGIVKAKIVNQATVLELLGIEASTVRNISKDVLSGDSSNRESVAASAYFRRLLPTGTRRVGEYSSALDYGYTVLRAGIGRMAVCGGWLVSRGIHHSNNLNAFNLVDDLIEPFRPVVDLMVVSEEMKGKLVPEMKKRLASIFEIIVRNSVGDVPLQIAIEAEMSSLKTAVRNHDARVLDLPQVLPLRSSVQE